MNVELFIDNTTIRGWKSVVVTKSIRALAGSFRAEIHDVAPGNRRQWMDLEGRRATLKCDGETALVAYLDDITLCYDGSSRRVTVEGASPAADLVDSSVPLGRGEFLNARLVDIAASLTKPFGISVRSLLAENPAIPSVRAETGEAIFALLEREAARQGCRVSSSPAGELLLFREPPGATVTLRTGEAHISLEKHGGRFAEVAVLVEPEGDSWGGGGAVGLVARAKDESVTRKSRTLVIRESGQLSQKDAERRARWEVAHRLGQSFRVRAGVHGWRHAAGLWCPGDKVRLEFPEEGIEGELLLETVRLSLDESGFLADLELVPPEALVPEPPKPEKRQEGVW